MRKISVAILLGVLLLSACAGQKNGSDDTTTAMESSLSEPSVNKANIHLTYSNLADDETKDRVRKALTNAGMEENNINEFFEAVDEYNNAVGNENLVNKMTTIEEAFPQYDSDKLIDLWIDKGGFVGRNCRITSYSLMKDFIKVGNPVAGDTTMLFSDFEGISEKNIFNESEKKNFDSIFSYIDVSNTMDVDVLAKEIQKDWENKQITFNNDKMHMISLFMTLDDGTNKVQEFIGHTGILVDDGDKYLFIEKLAFQMPYQVIEFNNRQELNDYLMGYYDVDAPGISAKPIVFEDDHVLPEYRVVN